MVQRFPSRGEALLNAAEQARHEEPIYQPKGYSCKTFQELRALMNNPAATWSYNTPEATQGTMVVMHKPTPTTKEYCVLSQYKGIWYRDLPEPPYLLYQRFTWTDAETVYVCEGERTSDAVEALGLAATTSLGGPTRAKYSDWTPLKGKHVVVLSDFDDKGKYYAKEVAQHCLGAGALSAKVVMCPGVQIGEGPREWMANVQLTLGAEAILPELQKLVDAAALEVYVPPVPEPPKGLQLEVISMADVKPVKQQWVFDKVIPQGKLTVLMGESGVGKSLTALEIAAKVSRGLTGPHADQPQEPGTVLLMTADDGIAENILPRLEASQADLSKVLVIPGFRDRDEQTKKELKWEFQLDRDMSFLEKKLKSLQEAGANVRMLVIDPIDCFMDAIRPKKKVSTFRIAGRVMPWPPPSDAPEEDLDAPRKKVDSEHISTRLAKLASEMNVAIVLVTNLPKNVKGTSKLTPSMRRKIDLGPFEAAARSVWMVGQDLENQNRRLLLPVKTNYCELPKSMAYQIVNGVIQWEPEPPALTGDQYLLKCEEKVHEQKPAGREEQSKLNWAVKWLKAELSKCAIPAKTVRRDAADNNISPATLRRAFKEVGAYSCKYAWAGPWNWSLQQSDEVIYEDQQTEIQTTDESQQEGESEE